MSLAAVISMTFVAAILTTSGIGLLRAQPDSRMLAAMVILLVGITLALVPLSHRFLVAQLNRQPQIWFQDLPFPFLLAPPTIAVLAVWPMVRRSRSDIVRPAFALWSWSAFFGAFSTWYMSHGFPLPFYSWTEFVIYSILQPTPSFSPFVLVIVSAIFLVPFLIFLARLHSRQHSRNH